MIIIYTGDGKGKTSACVGQTMRALGNNFKVAFGQFMKRRGLAGEQEILVKLLGDDYQAHGHGFYRDEKEKAIHRADAVKLLQWAESKIKDYDMVVLDEALYALGADILEKEELCRLMDKCDENNTHLVLSGRGAPEWLKERADLVSEVCMIKHPYQKGIKAQKGVEF